MLEPHFERLRSEVGDAVRQPDFITVRRRAGQVRRRRIVTSGAVFLSSVLTATVLGYAVQSGTDERGMAGPAPAASGVPDAVWPRMTSVANAGADLYGVLVPCMGCDSELYVSSDGGASWQRRTVPPQPEDAGTPRMAALISLAPGMVAWRDGRSVSIDEALNSASPSSAASPSTSSASPTTFDQHVGFRMVDRLWITSDGGRAWRRAVVDTQPVAAVPDGTRPVGCELLQVPACAVAVIDPATGRFAPLASQPSGIIVLRGWTSQVNVPLDGRLWVPGLDEATKKPAVATSSDAGRTWRTHVFTDGVPAVFHQGVPGTMYLPRVAAGSGATAYVLTYRADDVVDAHYTTDGGMTWRAGDTIRVALSSDEFVTADGSHIVDGDTGFVAARGTGRYTPVTLSGYPEDPTQTTQVTSRQAAERYLVTSETGPYLSKDGRTWRRVRLP